MIVTKEDIFQWCGVTADKQARDGARIDALILRVESDLEIELGRKIQDYDVTSVVLQHGVNCEVHNEKMYLTGVLRDLYSITSLYELGTLLTSAAVYGDGGDYFLDKNLGIITKIGGSWYRDQMAYTITGKVNISHSETPLEAIRKIVIEIVAAESGLWTTNYETEEGEVGTVIRTKISKETKEAKKKFVLRSV